MQSEINIKENNIEYELPEESIALNPVYPRDSCRLMVVHLSDMRVEDILFSDIHNYFESMDVIAVNNSRVIPARIKGRKNTGGKVEFLLLDKSDAGWKALGKPAARLNEGMTIDITGMNGESNSVEIVKKHPEGRFVIKVPDNILDYGYIPLPPYIASRRDTVESDYDDYQTNFAVCDGSVASPTSALHFTGNLLDVLKKKGVQIAPITLHVGPGTFKINYDKPEAEKYMFSEGNAALLNNAGRICVCGTTAMRTVETVFDGVEYVPSSGETDLFICPGHKFSRTKMFITNFHLPGTPLLMLVAAYIDQFSEGDGCRIIKELYARAIRKNYRFLSYGDAMMFVS